MSQRKTKYNQLEYCLNCGNQLSSSDQYCGICGQKAHDGKLPVMKLFREFMAGQLNLDGKSINTIRSLFVPGKLSIDYFKGKRKSQINPVRLFFVTAILALATLPFYNLPIENFDMLRKAMGSENSAESLRTIDSLHKVLIDRGVKQPDSIIKDLRSKLEIESDSIDLKNSDSSAIFSYFEDQLKGPSMVSRIDFEKSSPTQIVDQLELKGLTLIYFKQKIKFLKNPSSLIQYIISNLAWIYLCYIPIIALILKLIYIRRNKYYIEHLVFSLHMHTVFIIFLALAALLSPVTSERSWLILLIIFGIYLFIGIKRFYSQGYFKTFVKFWVLQVSYPVILTLFIALAALFSLIFF